MSSFQESRRRGFNAGADLSAKQYFFVKADATENQIVLAGLGEGFGVLMNAPASGERAEVAMNGGGALVKSAATISYGDEIASDANGNAIVALTGHIVLGIAMADAVSGDVFEIERVLYQKN